MPDVPDMIYRSLTISTGGREYSVWASELEPLLESILEDSMKRADDERWAKAGPFKLGRTWKVEEEVRENFMWRGSWFGMWTRRADSTPCGAHASAECRGCLPHNDYNPATRLYG
jgi:hypothetical protein